MARSTKRGSQIIEMMRDDGGRWRKNERQERVRQGFLTEEFQRRGGILEINLAANLPIVNCEVRARGGEEEAAGNGGRRNPLYLSTAHNAKLVHFIWSTCYLLWDRRNGESSSGS